jgi:hypothetical protein
VKIPEVYKFNWTHKKLEKLLCFPINLSQQYAEIEGTLYSPCTGNLESACRIITLFSSYHMGCSH